MVESRQSSELPPLEVRFAPRPPNQAIPVEVVDRQGLLSRMKGRMLHKRERADFHILVVCRSGTGTHYVDYEPVPLSAGTLMRIHPGQVQSYVVDSDLEASMVIWPRESHQPDPDRDQWFWCACGQSKNQPFCDGSHAGTDFTPLPFTPEAHLCACKRTGNAPFCDGTHAQFSDDQVGTDGSGTETPVALGDTGSATARATAEEPTVAFIHELARDGLTKLGHHGRMTSMGVPRKDLPHWDDLQIMAAQMATKPLLDEDAVGTELVIGPEAAKPLRLEIPLFVSDMSFGALSEEAKVALSAGAELAGTGICSGEGGMLPEEQQANSRYF